MYSTQQLDGYKAAIIKTLTRAIPASDLDEVATAIAQQLVAERVDLSETLLDLSLAELAETTLASVLQEALLGYVEDEATALQLASSLLEYLYRPVELEADIKHRAAKSRRARRKAQTELALHTAVEEAETDDLLTSDLCELCERVMPLTVHHLIPKSEHTRLMSRANTTYTKAWLLSSENTALICRPCHSAVHRLFTNEQLVEHGTTIERLCESDDVVKWVMFARSQRTSDMETGKHRGLKYRR